MTEAGMREAQEINTLYAQAIILLAFLEKRQQECKDAGEHRDIVWFNKNITNRNCPRNTIEGFCGYCLADLTRYPNEEERKAERDFVEKLSRPFTI